MKRWIETVQANLFETNNEKLRSNIQNFPSLGLGAANPTSHGIILRSHSVTLPRADRLTEAQRDWVRQGNKEDHQAVFLSVWALTGLISSLRWRNGRSATEFTQFFSASLLVILNTWGHVVLFSLSLSLSLSVRVCVCVWNGGWVCFTVSSVCYDIFSPKLRLWYFGRHVSVPEQSTLWQDSPPNF